MSQAYSVSSTILFTDLRHIRCGDLDWVAPDGTLLPVVGPPEPPVTVRPLLGIVPRGFQFVAQPAQKTEPIFADGAKLRTIRFVDGVYRAWHLQVTYPPGRDFGSYSKDTALSVAIAHSESRDGFSWSQPKLSPIEVTGQAGLDGLAVFVDPSAKSSERYKAVWMALAPKQQRARLWREYQRLHPRYQDPRQCRDCVTAMYGAVSPDGLRWKLIPRPLLIHKSDTDTIVEYDSWLGKYVLYTRLCRHDRRWVGRAETDDFRRWPSPEPLLWPTLDQLPSDDVYTNGKTRYPGSPGFHLAFPMSYHRDTQRSDVHLLTSDDGICWNRVPEGPVLTPGPRGAWDSAFIVASKEMVSLGRERVAIPYLGTAFPHKYPRWKHVLEAGRTAWAWWPKGRLIALHCPRAGSFSMIPLRFHGRRAHLNYRTARPGSVQVEVLVDGEVLKGRSFADCDPLSGDHPDRVVTWRGESDLGHKAGSAVELRFRLRNADLFSVEFR